MDIHSDSYKIAGFSNTDEAVEVIRKAEQELARLSGDKELTLIAYEKTTSETQG
ncbi:hypothetical protein [Paenibacillus sp. NFR01]|uniref:hypothetical protein n=1 Tax=Paenibacillus sp. NFR01 TaxID=1566279 RepID=UPI0008ACBD58|nr:hypothetical protein [Paenibacillus sp. NFR01]SET62342.1 hypothetical protein SAMN03159358_2216 [Paenibacillus sp. NFR01]